MATPILVAFSLSVLVSGVFSKSVMHDTVSLQSLNSDGGEVMAMPTKFDHELVQRLDSGGAVMPSLIERIKRVSGSGRRFKRESIRGHGCPAEYIFYMQRCMPFVTYERILEED